MSEIKIGTCPVCNGALRTSASSYPTSDDKRPFDCYTCGPYVLTDSAFESLGSVLTDEMSRARLSTWLRRRDEAGQGDAIDYDQLKTVAAETRLTPPGELLDLLLREIAEAQPSPGTPVQLRPLDIRAVVGAVRDADVVFGFHELAHAKLITSSDPTNEARHRLTLAGWDRLDELQRGRFSHNHAFMAMPFGDPLLDQVLEDCYKPAVARTGFELVRLDDVPKAGLIDDRLRVEIRTARFLIAELTHGNRGAYWEAGFAEGLGKPVIYTCHESYFHREPPYEDAGGSHFDTNHHLTVLWHQDRLGEAVVRLVASIRETLPDEARMSDE